MPCSDCNDLGYILRDGEPITCRCTARKKAIDAVRRIDGLGEFVKLGKACVDFASGRAVPLNGNAIIRSHWLPMVDHIAGWAFASIAANGTTPRVLVTTCARLRSMYLGGDGEKRQPGSQLIRLEEFELVVVRLLGIKNKLTPAALLEAVDFAATIWLVHPPDNTWHEGHPAWSIELESALRGARRLDLGPPPQGGIRQILGLTKGGDHA